MAEAEKATTPSVSFDTQSRDVSTRHPHIAEIAGARISYTLEVPHDIEDPVPLLIIGGWGGIKDTYKKLRQGVVDNGKPAITFKMPRTHSWFHALRPSHIREPQLLASKSIWGVMRDVMELHPELEIEQFDASAHSKGGQDVTNAALTKPQYFRSVTFKASVGLEERGDAVHPALVLGRRIPKFFTEELLPTLRNGEMELDKSAAQIALDAAWYFFRNPVRTARETMAVASADIRNGVYQLRNEHGIKVAFMGFSGDYLLPPSEAAKASRHLFDAFEEVDFVDSEESLGHMGPQRAPELVALAQLAILNKLHDPHLSLVDS